MTTYCAFWDWAETANPRIILNLYTFEFLLRFKKKMEQKPIRMMRSYVRWTTGREVL